MRTHAKCTKYIKLYMFINIEMKSSYMMKTKHSISFFFSFSYLKDLKTIEDFVIPFPIDAIPTSIYSEAQWIPVL